MREWLKLMLEEIRRKQTEALQDRHEPVLPSGSREGPGSKGGSSVEPELENPGHREGG